MSLDPAELIGGLTDNSNVPKADWLAYEKARNVARFADVVEVNNTNLSSRFVIVAGSYLYAKAAGDTTSADNGSTIIISLDGARWYRTGVASVALKGNWNAGTTYAVGDVVTYNNGSYICAVPNTNNVPAVGSSYWQVMALPGSPGGPISIPYTFDTTTTDSDPGNGKLRLGSATQNASTVIRADLLDNLGNTWTGILDTLDASTSTLKGFIQIQHEYDETKWLFFTLSARATPSGYRNLTVSCVGYSSANPFANGDPLLFEFVRTGDKGDLGNTGPAAWLAPVAWLTSTAYVAGPPASVVTFGGETYVCLVSHTSGTFATDLASSKWLKVASKGVDGTNGVTGPSGTSSLTICRAVATTNFTVASAIVNGATMDGVTLTTGDRVLLTGQTAPAENGVYIVAASGAASRDSSFNTYDSHPGVFFSIMEGTTNHDTLWQVTSDKGGTLGTTALTVAKFSSGGGGSGSADGFYRVRTVALVTTIVASQITNGATINGVTVATGDLVLLTNQSTASENGVYTVVASGAASRTPGLTTYNSLAGSYFAVSEGAFYADTLWQCTSDAGGTIGTTGLNFQQFMGAFDDWGFVSGTLSTTDDWGSV